MDPELERKNLMWGWLLAALLVVLFLGTFLVGLIYLQLD